MLMIHEIRRSYVTRTSWHPGIYLLVFGSTVEFHSWVNLVSNLSCSALLQGDHSVQNVHFQAWESKFVLPHLSTQYFYGSLFIKCTTTYLPHNMIPHCRHIHGLLVDRHTVKLTLVRKLTCLHFDTGIHI